MPSPNDRPLWYRRATGERVSRWANIKDNANRGEYNLQALLLFFSLPGVLYLIADWLGHD